MHSYVNGMSMRCREDNWKRILSVLRRRGIRVSRYLAEETKNGNGEAAVKLLEEIHHQLCQKVTSKE